MRTAILSVLTFGVVATSCSPSAPSAPSADAEPFAAARAGAPAGRAVPIAGECELRFTVLSASPPLIEQRDEGSCEISHLGRSAFSGVQQINVATGTQSGQRTLVAANGDMLHAVHSGTSTPAGPGMVSFQATLTFTGGTGRFAGASGEAQASGTASMVAGTATMRFEGGVVYQAASRAP